MAKQVAKFLVRAYQSVLSPFLGGQCRFYPSCSEYALMAIETNGAFKGLALAIWRVLRCQPFSKGGIDYPPHYHGDHQ